MAHLKPLDQFDPRAPQGGGATLPQDWLRVSEACAYCRVSKPKLYDLLNRGLVKSVSLKERGQTKGTRLVSFHSLKAFLESRASGGEQKTSPTSESTDVAHE